MSTPIPIPVPEIISFEKWAAFLAFAFPDQNVPIPMKVEEWDRWASLLRINQFFQDVPVPDTKLYQGKEGWRSWAMYFIMQYT